MLSRGNLRRSKIVSTTPRSIANALENRVEKYCEKAWYWVPKKTRASKPVVRAGKAIYETIRRRQSRAAGASYTRFFRNLPQLQVIAELVTGRPRDSALKIAVLGCSTGCELYSVLWKVRNCRADLKVRAFGLDVDPKSIDKARKGVYSIKDQEMERGLPDGTEKLFIRDGDYLRVAESYKEGITWLVGSACDPCLRERIGPCDFVMANNFLVHMVDSRATPCLKNIVRAVAPGGYLCVWGVNLYIRETVGAELGLEPITDRLEEIYAADDTALEVWPWKYWGAEPLDKTRPDWRRRYSSILRAGVRGVAG